MKHIKASRAIRKISLLYILIGMLTACQERGRQEGAAITTDSLLQEVRRDIPYEQAIQFVDSLEEARLISAVAADYTRGSLSFDNGQMKAEEYYYKKAVSATDIQDEADLRCYKYAVTNLTNRLLSKGDYEGALRTAIEGLERLEKEEDMTPGDKAGMLNSIGNCQMNLERLDDANHSYNQAFRLYEQVIAEEQSVRAYRDAIVGAFNTAIYYINAHHFNEAIPWIERSEKLVNEYLTKDNQDALFAEESVACVSLYWATALQGLGREAEAAKAFAKFQQSDYAKSDIGRLDATDYLMNSHRYQEAADNLKTLDALLQEWGFDYSLENIQGYLLPKYRANLGAGRIDSTLMVGRQICDRLDSAITWQKRSDAAELAAIYDTQQKDAEIAQQQVELSQQRMVGLGILMGLLSIFFVVYTLIRRRAARRLAEVKAAQERVESELRIARDIQMSMVPSTFPQREGLDMYASMTPAKEVGGDLYGYVMQGDKLYFAVGDVSGKGVPASLFMAQATRLFRTLATQGMMPADICTRMNEALSEDNESGMFVTMFMGLVDLGTGHLSFCNAGHNPPAIGSNTDHTSYITYHYLEMASNAPIGLWPDLAFEGEEIDTIKGQPLFIYTDGVNEAEDKQQQQFGDDHLLDILRNTHFDSARQVIETIAQAVEHHRNGAQPNDDLTMMCLRIN